MFFVLSKILHFLVKPILWIFFGGLFGAWKRRGSRKFWIRFVLFAYLVSNQFLVDLVLRTWEKQAIFASEIPTNATGIILLGGYSSYLPNVNRPLFSKSADRFLQALHVAETRNIAPIIFTGGSGNIYKPEEKEAVFIQNFLKESQLGSGAFLFEKESRNTYQNAINTLKLIEGHKLPKQNWVLVTSAFHMRRSAACFKKAGIQFTEFAVDHKAGPPKFQLEYILMPSADALVKWELLLHEWSGIVAYKLKGYI